MAVAIRVPDLGTTVDEIKLLNWLVREGDTVRRGDSIAEIETDKAVSELESVAEGVVLKQMVEADRTVETGTVLAYVGRPGEAIPESPTAGRVALVVRNLAAKLGIDLDTLEGTGHGGAITRADVRAAWRAGRVSVPAGRHTNVCRSPEEPSRGEAYPRSQAAVARAVSTSNAEIPHLRITADVDMTEARRVRTETAATGTKTSYDAMFVKAMARAIPAVPLVAARLEEGRVIHADGIHLAVAIGFANDLFLPVVRDVDQKDLAAVHQEIAELAERARAGRLSPEQMTGASMAVSSLARYPITSLDALIFPGHTCMLALGAVQERPVVADGQVVVRPMLTVKLAADHRLVNGRPAAAFLTRVKRIVESGRFL